MGKYDREDAEYFAEPHRQAELITNGVYHGKVKVHAEELVNLSGKYPSLRSISGVQERDVIYGYPPHNMKYGTEIENYPDYGMPRRYLSYDACEYEKEARKIHARHVKKEDYEDFIEKKSGMKENEHYTAIINTVLYLGEGHYRGRRTLRECFEIPEEIREYAWNKIQNYSFNLIEADYVNPLDYETELRQFFQAMQKRGDKRKLMKMLKREEFKKLTLETKRMIMLHLGNKKLIKIVEEEGEDLDMCKAIRDLIKDGKNEGREEGREEERLKSVKNLMETTKWTLEQVMDAMMLSDEERKIVIEKLQ